MRQICECRHLCRYVSMHSYNVCGTILSSNFSGSFRYLKSITRVRKISQLRSDGFTQMMSNPLSCSDTCNLRASQESASITCHPKGHASLHICSSEPQKDTILTGMPRDKALRFGIILGRILATTRDAASVTVDIHTIDTALNTTVKLLSFVQILY